MSNNTKKILNFRLKNKNISGAATPTLYYNNKPGGTVDAALGEFEIIITNLTASSCNLSKLQILIHTNYLIDPSASQAAITACSDNIISNLITTFPGATVTRSGNNAAIWNFDITYADSRPLVLVSGDTTFTIKGLTANNNFVPTIPKVFISFKPVTMFIGTKKINGQLQNIDINIQNMPAPTAGIPGISAVTISAEVKNQLAALTLAHQPPPMAFGVLGNNYLLMGPDIKNSFTIFISTEVPIEITDDFRISFGFYGENTPSFTIYDGYIPWNNRAGVDTFKYRPVASNPLFVEESCDDRGADLNGKSTIVVKQEGRFLVLPVNYTFDFYDIQLQGSMGICKLHIHVSGLKHYANHKFEVLFIKAPLAMLGNQIGIGKIPNVATAAALQATTINADSLTSPTINNTTLNSTTINNATLNSTTINLGTTPNVTSISNSIISFFNSIGEKLKLYTGYVLGIQPSTLYFRSDKNFAWYRGGVHDGIELSAGTGGTPDMVLTEGKLGIGKNNPSSALDVTGTSQLQLLQLNKSTKHGKIGLGSRIDFLSGGLDGTSQSKVSIEENFGLNLYGTNTQTVKIRNTNLEVKDGRVTDKTGDVMPVGSIIAYGGVWDANNDKGWVLCDGRSIADSKYADLRLVLGNKNNVPDLRGSFILGASQDENNFNGTHGMLIEDLNAYGSDNVVTLEAWFKADPADKTDDYQGIITKQFAFGIYLKSGNLIAYNYSSTTSADAISTGAPTVVVSAKDYNDGKFHHVAFKFNGTKGTLYIDGVGTIMLPFSISHMRSKLIIGAGGIDSLNNFFQGFKGIIRKVKVFNRALSDAEITTDNISDTIKNGLTIYRILFFNKGDVGGESEHTLTIDEMPAHNHKVPSGSGFLSGNDSGGAQGYAQGGMFNTISEHPQTANTGGNQAHNNMPPYYALTYIIKY